MKRLICAFLFCSALLGTHSAVAASHCEQYLGSGLMESLVRELATKLKYSYEEFCNNPRIMDIYHERKMVHHQDDDQYHPYEFVTIHYNEYSCEYRYNINAKAWGHQHCYNTF